MKHSRSKSILRRRRHGDLASCLSSPRQRRCFLVLNFPHHNQLVNHANAEYQSIAHAQVYSLIRTASSLLPRVPAHVVGDCQIL
jgi:hypothetical protein